MHLIEWDTFEFRVSGDRISEMAQPFRIDPIEQFRFRFENGLLRIEGTARKFVSIPFRVDVTELHAEKTTVRIPVRSASAFGAIPIPRFLFSLVKGRLPRDIVQFEEPATFVVALDRFLPTFVSIDIQRIWIIDGGLMVVLGRGGADPPTLEGSAS